MNATTNGTADNMTPYVTNLWSTHGKALQSINPQAFSPRALLLVRTIAHIQDGLYSVPQGEDLTRALSSLLITRPTSASWSDWDEAWNGHSDDLAELYMWLAYGQTMPGPELVHDAWALARMIKWSKADGTLAVFQDQVRADRPIFKLAFGWTTPSNTQVRHQKNLVPFNNLALDEQSKDYVPLLAITTSCFLFPDAVNELKATMLKTAYDMERRVIAKEIETTDYLGSDGMRGGGGRKKKASPRKKAPAKRKPASKAKKP